MTIKECYEQINGDYDGVLQRLMSDERIRKYLYRFWEEELLQSLNDFIEKEDYGEAFRCVHSIKGVCMNLGLSKLQDSSSELCEALRGGNRPDNLEVMLEKVREDYEKVIGAIKQLS